MVKVNHKGNSGENIFQNIFQTLSCIRVSDGIA